MHCRFFTPSIYPRDFPFDRVLAISHYPQALVSGSILNRYLNFDLISLIYRLLTRLHRHQFFLFRVTLSR
jgi:hypothetical protein